MAKLLLTTFLKKMTNQEDIFTGILTVSLNDHLPQFIIINNENSKSKTLLPKFSRDFKNFNSEDFILDFLSIDFDEITRTPDLNNSFNSCLDKIDKLINVHLPLRKMTKKEVKTKSTPWTSLGLRNSMHRRNCL